MSNKYVGDIDNHNYYWCALSRKQKSRNLPKFYSSKASDGKFTKVFLHLTFALYGKLIYNSNKTFRRIREEQCLSNDDFVICYL